MCGQDAPEHEDLYQVVPPENLVIIVRLIENLRQVAVDATKLQQCDKLAGIEPIAQLLRALEVDFTRMIYNSYEVALDS